MFRCIAFPVGPVCVSLRVRSQSEAEVARQAMSEPHRPFHPRHPCTLPAMWTLWFRVQGAGTSYIYTSRSKTATSRSDTHGQPPTEPPEKHFEGYPCSLCDRKNPGITVFPQTTQPPPVCSILSHCMGIPSRYSQCTRLHFYNVYYSMSI